MFSDETRSPLRVAVVSTHPDDETFGPGGTLARHARRGDRVYACIVTEAYEPDWPGEGIRLIREHARQAFDALGISEAIFLGFPTVKLNTVPNKELTDRLQGFVDDVRPDVVYAPFPGDLNADHSIVAKAAAVAARPVKGRRITLFYYEVLSSTEWGRIYLNRGFHPNLYVDISTTLKDKLNAAEMYSMEIRDFPHPRSSQGIETLARMRGMEVGLEAAEALQMALRVS